MNVRIRQARRMLGLNQEEFAARVGVSKRTIGFWERGYRQPRARNLGRLAAATGLPIPWFFGGEG